MENKRVIKKDYIDAFEVLDEKITYPIPMDSDELAISLNALNVVSLALDTLSVFETTIGISLENLMSVGNQGWVWVRDRGSNKFIKVAVLNLIKETHRTFVITVDNSMYGRHLNFSEDLFLSDYEKTWWLKKPEENEKI